MTEKLTDSLNKHDISKSKIKKSPKYRCPKPDCGSPDVDAFVSYNRCRTCGYESRDFQEWERE
jgi:DNA-directed RNA polymerase subunit RPC12/RpoP